MTKKEIMAKLEALGVAFRKKDTLEVLQGKLNEAEAAAAEAAAQKPQRKERVNTKTLIRQQFPAVGTRVSAQDLRQAMPRVARSTIQTMISDLKNPKYCGAAGVIVIQRKVEGDEEVYERVQ